MKVAYIAGKYRAKTEWEVQQNIRNAEAVALEYWRQDFAVICPHKNCAFLGGACDDSVWLNGDLEILKRCDIIVMLEGWEQSEGACHERAVAIEHGKEIVYRVTTTETELEVAKIWTGSEL